MSSSGEGVGGVHVRALSFGPPDTSASACTAADGSYSLSLPTGTYTVIIRATLSSYPGPSCDAFLEAYSTSVSGVNVTANTTLNFTLPPIYALAGRVVDATGNGVGGVLVLVRRPGSGTAVRSAMTAVDGSYSALVYAGTYDVALSFGWTTYTAETGVALTGNTVRNYTLFNP